MITSLVIGSGGFCGRHLVARLSREPDSRVFGLERRAAGPPSVLGADVRDFEAVRAAIREIRPDRVFNLAGITAGEPYEMNSVNVGGTLNVLEAIRLEVPHARVLLVGTAAEYGDFSRERMPLSEESPCSPRTPYGASKLAATIAGIDYARRYGMHVVVARPFNLVGAGAPTTQLTGALVNRLKIAAGDPSVTHIDVGNTSTTRDFVPVEIAIDAYVDLVSSAAPAEVYNLCSGRPVPVQFVIDTLRSFAGRQIEVRHKAELMRPDDPPAVYGSFEKARRVIGFNPVFSLEESLRQAWDAWRGPAGRV